jgi:hypothetical protein
MNKIKSSEYKTEMFIQGSKRGLSLFDERGVIPCRDILFLSLKAAQKQTGY